MKRRVLLERLGAVTAAGALAGCLDEATDDPDSGGDGEDGVDDGDGGTGENETDGTGDDGDTDEANEPNGSENDATDQNETETGEGDGSEEEADEGEESNARISDEEITTTNADCGEGNEASITFADDAVELEGTLMASDPCHEAVLAAVSIEDDELEVTVGTERVDEEMCSQCIARVDYEATVRFESASPSVATVEHEGDDGTEEVTRERREG